MALVSIGPEEASIMGMSEVSAQQKLAQLFMQIAPASQEFLLGMAIDLAAEDPKPKKSGRLDGAAKLQLVVC